VAATEEAGAQEAKQEFYELRMMRLRMGPMQKLADDYFRDAYIPAMKRIGIGPIGVFDIGIGPDSPAKYILIPHKSMDSIAMAAARLAVDDEYHRAGAEFQNRPATSPAYIRMESSVMISFAGMAKLAVPDTTKPRLFELRTYESHSKRANRKKIEMFNTGEIAIFKKNGLNPVFFGELLVGPRHPNLTYMLVYDDMAAHDKAWGAFINDPDWKALSGKPEYANSEILTNISNVFLRPTPYSQI
jgi:hypothetical protein